MSGDWTLNNTEPKLPLNPYLNETIDRDVPEGEALLKMVREMTPKWKNMLDYYGIEYEIYDTACARGEGDAFQESYDDFCEGKGHEGWIGTQWDDQNLNRGCTFPGLVNPIMCYNPMENQEQCCLSKKAREFDLPDNCEIWNSPSPPCVMKETVNLRCSGDYTDYSRGSCDSIFRGTESSQGDSCMSYFKEYPSYIDPETFHLNIPENLNIGLSPYDKTFIKRCNEWMDTTDKDKSQIMKSACNNVDVLIDEEHIEASGGIAPCHEWCRQNPGQCDSGIGNYCSDKIENICGSASSNSICVDFIPSVCSCVYWSQHGMPQPQCYSPTCQGGRAGEQPGYKTSAMDMSLDGSACGQYCKQVIDLAAKNDVILSGEIEQDCILIQDNMSKESEKEENTVSSGGTTTNSTGKVSLDDGDDVELFSVD